MYALDLIEQYKSRPQSILLHSTNKVPLGFIMNHYEDKTPTVVAGSCGSTSNSSKETNSSNLFNKYSSLSELFGKVDYKNDPNLCKCGSPGDAHFHCPGETADGEDCKNAIIVGKHINKCSNCGLEATCT